MSEAQTLAFLRGRLVTARDKFLQMVDAVPEDAWDYRPMEGVRSFGEVFIHIAADNWVPVWTDLPNEYVAPITRSEASLRGYQASARSKAETRAEMARSFEYLLSALDASPGHLNDRFQFGGREWTVGELWIALTTHMHEHLGQSIAYARSNRIVPPWSR